MYRVNASASAAVFEFTLSLHLDFHLFEFFEIYAHVNDRMLNECNNVAVEYAIEIEMLISISIALS